jgi:hypothetical protein
MLLDRLNNSIPVKSKNIIKTTAKSLLVLTLMSLNAQSETYYDDYASEELKSVINKQVEVLGKFREVKFRESLGCPTGELRAELGSILRNNLVKGQKLDITEKDYAKSVDNLVVSATYKHVGECGVSQPKANVTEKEYIEKYFSKNQKKEIAKRSSLELKEVRKKLDL